MPDLLFKMKSCSKVGMVMALGQNWVWAWWPALEGAGPLHEDMNSTGSPF
jgi:hypothetical protein